MWEERLSAGCWPGRCFSVGTWRLVWLLQRGRVGTGVGRLATDRGDEAGCGQVRAMARFQRSWSGLVRSSRGCGSSSLAVPAVGRHSVQAKSPVRQANALKPDPAPRDVRRRIARTSAASEMAWLASGCAPCCAHEVGIPVEKTQAPHGIEEQMYAALSSEGDQDMRACGGGPGGRSRSEPCSAQVPPPQLHTRRRLPNPAVLGKALVCSSARAESRRWNSLRSRLFDGGHRLPEF